MTTYIVHIQEKWIQPVRIEADNAADALEKVWLGEGEYIESGLEYSETLASGTWHVEEE